MKIGIDLGGSHIAIGLVEKEIILKKIEYDFSKEEKENLESTIKKVIKSAIENILKEYSIEGIKMVGISVPGRPKNGCIQYAANLKVKELNIENIVKECIDKPVYIMNDGMCAGIAEKEYGNLKGCNNGVFLGFGTGIGTAVFIKGKLVEEVRSARSYDY